MKEQWLFPDNLRHDPQHILDGMLVLRCMYVCGTYQTPIGYDMSIHLRENHNKALVERLSLTGKGHGMQYTAEYTIDIMGRAEPKIYYDHKTAEFAPPEVIQTSSIYGRLIKKEAVIRSKPKKERKESCLIPITESDEVLEE